MGFFQLLYILKSKENVQNECTKELGEVFPYLITTEYGYGYKLLLNLNLPKPATGYCWFLFSKLLLMPWILIRI